MDYWRHGRSCDISEMSNGTGWIGGLAKSTPWLQALARAANPANPARVEGQMGSHTRLGRDRRRTQAGDKDCIHICVHVISVGRHAI